jgi:glycosyltransferase involved in cell wall biosynthesis
MTDYFIVSFISKDWEMYQRVPHYTAMSKYAKVLCVELPLTIFDIILRPKKAWIQRSKIKNRLRKINENLLVYTPITMIPFGLSYRNGLLRRLNKLFISYELKKVINKLHIKKYVTILHAPHLSCLVDVLSPLARVYEISDEKCTTEKYPNLSDLNIAAKILEREERKLLSKVDIVFTTSKKLYERKCKYNKNSYFIPNGVDLEHFKSSGNKKLSDIIEIRRPRIGYVGHINNLLDFEWLDYSAEMHPEWSFVLIGILDNKAILNKSVDYSNFIKRSNVFMLGWKKYEYLPGYMGEIDVFLLPRKNCDYSQNSNPNKIYQYLSTGKPIVSSKFSSVEHFEGPILIANDKYSFLAKIEKAVCENNSKLKDQRLELARRNDLKLRAREKIDILNELLVMKKK